MAILTGLEIELQRKLGKLTIEPFEPAHLNPNSYDLRLGDELLTYEMDVPDGGEIWVPTNTGKKLIRRILDMKKENAVNRLVIPPEGVILLPNCLYLGKTFEWTGTHGFAPMVEGRSSIGRLGISVHVTAGFGDHGFIGRWTLEITVVHPVRVYAGVRIAQIGYHTLEGDASQPYKGKYQHQEGCVPSRLWSDFPKG